jgi:hypothetical protein
MQRNMERKKSKEKGSRKSPSSGVDVAKASSGEGGHNSGKKENGKRKRLNKGKAGPKKRSKPGKRQRQALKVASTPG